MLRKIFWINLLMVLVFFNAGRAASVSILCYHSFWGVPKYGYDFSLTELKTQLDFFKKNDFKFVNYQDVLKGKVTGNRNLLVTIDDGNRSAYPAYVKVFRPYKIQPLFAIYPAIISKQRYALTWDNVNEFLKDGCEVICHGYNHLFVAQKLYDKNRTAFDREVFGSRLILEKKLKRPIDLFAYPFGVYSDISFKKVKEAKYRYAFALNGQTALLPLERNPNIYAIPRYLVTRGNWKVLPSKILKDVQALERQGKLIGG